MSRRLLLLNLAAGVALISTSLGIAQTRVDGTAVALVRDAKGNRIKVVGVRVELRDANGKLLDAMKTGPNGEFSFPTSSVDANIIRAQAGDSYSLRFSGLDQSTKERADTTVASLDPDKTLKGLNVVVPEAKHDLHPIDPIPTPDCCPQPDCCPLPDCCSSRKGLFRRLFGR